MSKKLKTPAKKSVGLFTKTKTVGEFARCAHNHPALPLCDGLVIYGGACSDIVVDDVDISVGLDSGFRPTGNMYPWQGRTEVLFKIQDMGVPTSSAQFIKLISFIDRQLRKGKKVHVGCIGGHGRTGIVLAALVSKMLPSEKDAIGYVREHYCVKAVESKKQVDWLIEHFGVKKVKGAKEGKNLGRGYSSPHTGQGSYGYKSYLGPSPTGYPGNLESIPKDYGTKYMKPDRIEPLPGPDSIWYDVTGPLTTDLIKLK